MGAKKMNSSKSLVVMLVEDDTGDQKLIKSALAMQQENTELHIAASAEEALGYLDDIAKLDADSPWPDLILLDLNMPGMGGKEFLRHMKSHEDLCSIPVVVLTTSDSETDVRECYESHAAGYIQKPTSATELKRILKETTRYWLTNGSSAKA
jgi:CheY-like chemotaxis protein